MYNLDCIYVSSSEPSEVEDIIRKATNSIYAHAATILEIEGCIRTVEAVRPMVHMAKGDLYSDYAIKQVISFQITAEQRLAVVERAFELLGKKYGLDDCLISGVEDVICEAASEFIEKLIDDVETYNCSHTQIELIRAAFPDFAKGIDSVKVTPEHARILVSAFYDEVTAVPQV